MLGSSTAPIVYIFDVSGCSLELPPMMPLSWTLGSPLPAAAPHCAATAAFAGAAQGSPFVGSALWVAPEYSSLSDGARKPVE